MNIMEQNHDTSCVGSDRAGPGRSDLSAQLAALSDLDPEKLRVMWRRLYRSHPPKGLSRDLMVRAVAYKLQERAFGSLSKSTLRRLKSLAGKLEAGGKRSFAAPLSLKPGTRLVREWDGETHSVLVLEYGFEYRGQDYRSLSQVARRITGAHWSGPRFFSLGQIPRPFEPRVEPCHE